MEPSYRARRGLVKQLLSSAMLRLSGLLPVLALLAPASLPGQGLPSFDPINPVAASRSGLGFEPYHDPRPDRWLVTLALDYATTIEANERPQARYLLDSELLRLDLQARRDVSPRLFLLAEAEVRGAYAGFLDGFLDWYHGVLGFDIPERDARPNDEFLYDVTPPGGPLLRADPSDLFLGDARVGAGLRWTRHLQSIALVTLPTATGPDGYGRGVASVNLLNTVRTGVAHRLVYEGSLSFGYTARHGRLAPLQREAMVAASSGLRLGVWGRHALYGNLFYHSPYYRDTGFPSMDRRELSFDFGWALAGIGGSEWRVGLTEDLEPGGPAIDLVVRLGRSF